MSRYVTIATRSWSSSTHSPETLPTCTVYENDAAPEDTGLVDSGGTRIFRVRDRAPIGFVVKA